jgi:hypothetical protein
LSDTELKKFEILLEVLDMSDFKLNKLVGSESINLNTLYQSMDHELYQQWLTLTNPNDNMAGDEATGFLMVSCYIIGANDRPPVHNLTGAGTYGKN